MYLCKCEYLQIEMRVSKHQKGEHSITIACEKQKPLFYNITFYFYLSFDTHLYSTFILAIAWSSL